MAYRDTVKAFSALEAVSDHYGGRTKLAKKLLAGGLEITPQQVGNWKRVPLRYVKQFSTITGVSVVELMPESGD